MERSSEQLFTEEAGNWLSRGRSELLAQLLAAHLPPADQGRRLLEIGAGFGENVPALARFGQVDVVEISDLLAARLQDHPQVDRLYREPIPTLTLSDRYHTIVAWDVLEHIDRDDLAVDWVSEHLVPGGLFLAAVPAYSWLFSDHDRAIHHYRRYTAPQLTRLLTSAQLRLCQSGYFNTVLFPAAVTSRFLWQLRRRLRGEAGVPAKQSSAANDRFDRVFGRILEFEARRIGSGSRLPFGLTAVCAARR